MAIAGVGVCLHCEAVVNLHWSRCAVCDKPLEGQQNLPTKEAVLVGTPDATDNAQSAFTFNAGPLRNTPVRHALYEPGQMVKIHSPMVGTFQAEVLRDNGAVLWVWHPYLEREAAIPHEWVVGEGGT